MPSGRSEKKAELEINNGKSGNCFKVFRSLIHIQNFPPLIGWDLASVCKFIACVTYAVSLSVMILS